MIEITLNHFRKLHESLLCHVAPTKQTTFFPLFCWFICHLWKSRQHRRVQLFLRGSCGRNALDFNCLPHPPTSFCSCCVYEKQTKTCGSWRRRLFFAGKEFQSSFLFLTSLRQGLKIESLMDRVCAGGRRAEAKRQDCSDVIKRWTRAMWLGLKTVEPPASSWAYIYNNADGQHLKNVSPASALLATTLIAIPQLQKKKNKQQVYRTDNCRTAAVLLCTLNFSLYLKSADWISLKNGEKKKVGWKLCGILS